MSIIELKIRFKFMKSIFTYIIFLLAINQSIAQNLYLNNSTWKYSKLILITQNDSLYIYNSDSLKNFYNLQNIKIFFKTNNLYEGISFNGLTKNGFWQIYNQNIVIDGDTNSIISHSNNYLKFKAEISTSDFGSLISGQLITELVKVPVYTSINSIKSGNWSNQQSWDCECIPTEYDSVTINNGHTITIDGEVVSANKVIFFGGEILYLNSGLLRLRMP